MRGAFGASEQPASILAEGDYVEMLLGVADLEQRANIEMRAHARDGPHGPVHAEDAQERLRPENGDIAFRLRLAAEIRGCAGDGVEKRFSIAVPGLELAADVIQDIFELYRGVPGFIPGENDRNRWSRGADQLPYILGRASCRERV